MYSSQRLAQTLALAAVAAAAAPAAASASEIRDPAVHTSPVGPAVSSSSQQGESDGDQTLALVLSGTGLVIAGSAVGARYLVRPRQRVGHPGH